MENDRTKRVSKSLFFGLTNYFLKIIIKFIFRKVFISVFLVDLLGIDSLFASILTLLSLSELGVSSVVVALLFKPVADNNYEKISSIMKFYKHFYQIVGFIVLILGIAICPFLHIFIGDVSYLNVNIYIVYLLFLVNSVATYFLSYRSILFLLYQDRDVEYKTLIIINVITALLQILVILISKNYYFYLSVTIGCSILTNLILFIITNKRYSFISIKNAQPLTLEDKTSLRKNIKGILYHKISYVVLQATDSIIISAFIGIKILGIYSNYLVITSSITMIITLMLDALRGSVGNYIVTNNPEQNYELFNKLRFAFYWISGFCAICCFVLFEPFISVWLGTDYVLTDIYLVFVICFNLFLYTSRSIVGLFRESIGMFDKDRFKGIIEAGLNVLISLVLVKFLGLTGVILGTIISCLLTSSIVDPYMVYKYLFHKSLKDHFIKKLFYTSVTIVGGGITYFICSLIPLYGWAGLLIRIAICVILPNLIFVLCYMFTKTFKSSKQFLKQTIIQIFKKKKRNTQIEQGEIENISQ